MRKSKETNSDFIKLGNQFDIKHTEDIKFTDLSDYMSLVDYINKRGFYQNIMEVFCEKNRRTPLQKGLTLINKDNKNVQAFYQRRYGECLCVVNIQGVNSVWPFTMLYVKKSWVEGNI